MEFPYQSQYYVYKDLCEKGYQKINTKDLNQGNIDTHFNAIINILKDGIETKCVQSMKINVLFVDGIDVNLSIFDYVINLMFWQLLTSVNQQIESIHLVFFEDITKRAIKEYIDNIFIDRYRKLIPFKDMNIIIDSVIGKFRELRVFQVYLANTLNLEDTIDLMNQYKEFNDTIHFNPDGIPLEDVKEAGMQAANTQINYIKNSNHCLRDSFRTGEAISPKQYKEVAVNIGTKPTGQGGIFPHPISTSFMNGGLQTAEDMCVDSSVGRVAQILQKTNVGESGSFARKLELNNLDTRLHPDPTYVCDTQNFEEVELENPTILQMYDLRYYRENPNGVDKLLNAKNDKNKLLHKKLLFRSPMCCASAARGEGICYKCYGDLAYANQDINVGQIAAEGLSSIYTQILLSAKHLLESLVIKMEWTQGFDEVLQISFNTIGLIEGMSYKGYKLIINEDIKSQEELDEIDYNYYINNFIIQKPDGSQINIHTTESDNIYFYGEFLDMVMNALKDYNDDDNIYLEFNMAALENLDALFIVEIRNNELSATMDKIEKLINNKGVIESYNRHEILREFINTNIKGNIKLNAVHFEVLLMNQIRDVDDILDVPDWTIPDAPYRILTLDKSLSENRSITIRLQSSKVQKTLLNPLNRFISKPSVMDLYYMEQPQEYLNEEDLSDDFDVSLDDSEVNIEEPFKFDNPKIRVGSKVKKRKIPKSRKIE